MCHCDWAVRSFDFSQYATFSFTYWRHSIHASCGVRSSSHGSRSNAYFKNISFNFTPVDVCVCIRVLSAYLYHTCAVPMEARRRCQIILNWSYRLLWFIWCGRGQYWLSWALSPSLVTGFMIFKIDFIIVYIWICTCDDIREVGEELLWVNPYIASCQTCRSNSQSQPWQQFLYLMIHDANH